ncbi:hypothetical protein H310_09797 [Aphanomyces invadans]|uniref:LRRNT domain-containing protein n=1 Tax=Aphanomyces invadans TaxID=157072 RepID=A0A024TS30_9STRA|nr:hypothetical protein H310_09797 [Aphanomyces invadans]ETV96935.1 hypothetical protein H310_09797 [Aphanomyces invadans]|eukprot:XP_008874181.1 hypothetical protein H310_09797 [Aphanomyces invadans]
MLCKLGMHLGTFISLRLSQSSLQMLKATAYRPPQAPSARGRRYFRWLLRINLVVNVGWSVVLLVWMGIALGVDRSCPVYCLAQATPLWDMTCQCAYANINCAKLNIADPAPLLSHTIVGTSLFYLQVSRCAVPDGLPPPVLAPFQNLGKVSILFSNLSTWDGPLPPSVGFVSIRFSPALETIPRALYGHDLSPRLVVLVVEGCPVRSIPRSVIETWSNLVFLSLINISLAEYPTDLSRLPHLELLNLKLNQLASVPEALGAPPDLPSLRTARFSWNQLVQVPETLAARNKVVVELSGNPIASPGNTTSVALQQRTLRVLGEMDWRPLL